MEVQSESVRMSRQKEAILTETWKKTLAGIATLPGRLAYLASLRNVNTGTYEHAGLAQRVGAADTDELLRNSHQETFHEWLSYGLEQQKQEVEEYFSDLGDDKPQILESWIALSPYQSWVPAETRDAERQLFASDLSAVIELLRTEYGVASRDPES